MMKAVVEQEKIDWAVEQYLKANLENAQFVNGFADEVKVLYGVVAIASHSENGPLLQLMSVDAFYEWVFVASSWNDGADDFESFQDALNHYRRE